MCGITGFCDFTKKSDKRTLINMTDILHHRGPDDSGYSFYKQDDFNIGLGHRRLSILDLSSDGHQPMIFEDYEIVYNGEVYNFQEIRVELEKYNYTFKSDSDTEVILKSYHLWGIDSINKFNGMFAIAIYDKKDKKLFLARDRIGKKPLYYTFINNTFIFASELKSLMIYPTFEKIINKDALNLFLFYGYIVAPYTIFNDCYKLEAGNYLEFNLKDRTLDINSYWSIKKTFLNREIIEENERSLLDRLDNLLTKAVRYRMISDVPIGSFLSGGYDSSLISAIMQKLSPTPIDTFTIGFNEKDFNEANYAKKVAKYLETNHHELYLPIKDAEPLIFEISKYYDEPFADDSQIATMLVSRLAKESVTVALSGDGGDELFCGYSRYESVVKQQQYKYISKVYSKVNRLFNIDRLSSKIDKKLPKLSYMYSDDTIVNFKYLYTNLYLDGLVKDNSYKIDKKYFDIINLSKNIQEKYMLQDMITYLPDDILLKVDRASMAFSLESRTPILDFNIIEFSMNIPHSLKYKNGDKKYILKRLTHQYIPKEIMDRPKKGFGVPVSNWLHTDLHYLIDCYLNYEYILKQNIFDYEKIKVLLKGFDNRDIYSERFIWHIIIFQLWYEEYMI